MPVCAQDYRTSRRSVSLELGTHGMAVGLLAAACVLAAGGCSTAPSGRDGGGDPGTPDVSEGATIPDAPGAPGAPGALQGDNAPEETRREVRQVWEKFRGLLLKGEEDAEAYRGVVDEPDGFAHLELCLAEGVDLSVEWLRMSSEDLKRVEANFRFFLDREECEIYFTGLDDEAPPELLVRLIDGRWVVWPQRG